MKRSGEKKTKKKQNDCISSRKFFPTPKKGDPLGFLNMQFFLQNTKKMKERPFGDIENFRKMSHKAEKEGRESLIVPKKMKKGPFCFAMVLYFMLEALDAFKIKY